MNRLIKNTINHIKGVSGQTNPMFLSYLETKLQGLSTNEIYKLRAIIRSYERSSDEDIVATAKLLLRAIPLN